MHLRNNSSRRQMFQEWDPQADTSGYDAHNSDLTSRLLSNPFFMAMPAGQRAHLLRGNSAVMLTQDEILQRMGLSSETLRHFRGSTGYCQRRCTRLHSRSIELVRSGGAVWRTRQTRTKSPLGSRRQPSVSG